MLDEAGCLACDLSHGRRDLPGGLIHRTPGWLFVVQPTEASGSEPAELHGPALQAAMFARNHHPERTAVEQFAARARTLFART